MEHHSLNPSLLFFFSADEIKNNARVRKATRPGFPGIQEAVPVPPPETRSYQRAGDQVRRNASPNPELKEEEEEGEEEEKEGKEKEGKEEEEGEKEGKEKEG